MQLFLKILMLVLLSAAFTVLHLALLHALADEVYTRAS